MTSTNMAFSVTISTILSRCFGVFKIGHTLAAVLLLFGAPLFAQTLDWVNHPLVQPPVYGGHDDGKAIATDASGNVYVTGYYTNTADFDPGAGTANLTSAGASDIFIAKYDALGNYLWAKSVGGTSVEAGYGIALDGSGNVYVTGSFDGTADFDPGVGVANRTSMGTADIFIAKYDASGNYIWAKSMGSADSDTGYGIAVDGSGNAHITGYFQNTVDFDPGAGAANLVSTGVYDIFFAKYDASGNYLWAKSAGNSNNNDVGYGIAVDGSGNVHITGYFANTVDFDPGAGTANLTFTGTVDVFIAKYDASGNYIWAKSVGGTSFDEGRSIAVDGSGNVHITGYFWNTMDFDPGAGTANRTSVSLGDIFIAKYSASGNYLWANSMGGVADDIGYGLALDGSGNVHVTGNFSNTVDFDAGAGMANLTSAGGGNSNDVFIVKYDASGNYTWAKNVGGESLDVGYGIAVSGSGNVHVTGSFEGAADFDPGAGVATLTPGTGTSDAFILRLSPAGNYNWAINWGQYSTQPSGMDCHAIARDASGNTYVTGYFDGEHVDFDPGPGMATLTNIFGIQNVFIAKYDASGNYVWAKSLVGNSTAWGEGIAVDGSGNVYITGFFYGTVDFDPGAGTANRSSLGDNDMFIAKYDASGNYIWAKSMGGPDSDLGFEITLDGGGNAYLTGFFSATVDFDPSANIADLTSAGYLDIFIAKYDASGNYIWAKSMGGIGNDIGNSIALDGSGNVHITGYFQGPADFDPSAGTATLNGMGGQDIFIAKYDASGNYIWAKGISSANGKNSNDLALDGSGNVYITGYFQETLDFDPGAGTANLTSLGSYDIFIAKYNALGNYLWAKRVGGNGQDAGAGLDLDGGGNIYLTGYFQQTADFDPGAGTANMTSAGLSDIFIAQYDASGNYLAAIQAGNTGSESGVCIAVGSAGTINVGGYFGRTVDFDPGAGTTNHTAIAINGDIFVAQYNFSVVEPEINLKGNGIGIADGDMSPNAADGTDFGGVCVAGGTNPNTFTIENTGAANLALAMNSITITGAHAGDFTLSGIVLPATIAPGASTTFTVTFDPSASGLRTAVVNIANNDGNENPYNFAIQGTGWTEASLTACPAAPIMVNTDPGQCTAVVSYSVTATGTPAPLLTYSYSGATVANGNGSGSGSAFNRGLTTVTVTATSPCNSVTCTFTVTVTDNQPPSLTCPNNIVRNNDFNQCSAFITYVPTVTDNCSATVTVTSGLPSGSAFPKGTTSVALKATDPAGLTATCQFNVTVVDAQAPTISCPLNIIRANDAGQCAAAVTYTTPTYFDNCPGAGVAIQAGNAPSGTVFPVGTTWVSWQATDAVGLTATCSFSVTVQDAQAPSITCPANQAVGNDLGQCYATVTFATPTATDNCILPSNAVTQTTGPASGSTFPKGTTTVAFKVTDAAGLTKTCSFRIIVNDTERPVIPACSTVAPANTAPGLCTATVTYANPTFTDNCAPVSGTTTRISGPSSGSAFPAGNTNVIFRATDAAGNSTTCLMVVTVVDNQLPIINCPPSTTVSGSGTPCTATVFYAAPTASDNCAGSLSPFLVSGLASGSVFSVGTTVNTWRAAAPNGQTAECTVSVTVNCATPRSIGAVDRVEEASTNGVRRYALSPNPAMEVVNITWEGDAPDHVAVFDAQGRLAWEQAAKIEAQSLRIAVSGWATGVYMVVLRAEGIVVTKRLVRM